MHRFFVLQQGDGRPAWPSGAEVTLSETDSAHVARVLRLRPGQKVIVCDGRGFDYEAEIVAVAPKAVVARLGPPSASKAEPALHLTLIQGVAKGSKMDFIIQKAVEVGVSRIIPVETERTVVRLKGDKADARVERWQRIAYEAAKQAGRGRIPTVEPVSSWRDLWSRDDLGAVVVPWEDEAGSGLMETIRRLAAEGAAESAGAWGSAESAGAWGSAESAGAWGSAEYRERVPRLAVAIGPEGGYSQEEIELAMRSGAQSVSLGPRILRTETAAIVACGLVLAAFGELG